MSVSVPVFAKDAKPPSEFRPIADFHPSVWGDHFISYLSPSHELDHNIGTQIETLKKEVSKMIVSETHNPLAKVDLIDSISRLGVKYHFESEIDEALQQIHKNYVVNGEIIIEANLGSLAVLFRILRQHGFHVSPLVFNKFKDLQGNFSERLFSDVEGILSLYEASHVMIHGEEILEEALAFTSTQLKSIVTTLSPFLAAQVNHSLRQSLHKNLPRLEARRYISTYEQHPYHNEILLTLAKLDFNKLQHLHQKEFGNICQWWKDLDISSKLPYVRDRIVELCFWTLGAYFEPQYSQARNILVKTFAMALITDDIYDAYGTIDELELLTKAIERLNRKLVKTNFLHYLFFIRKQNYVIILMNLIFRWDMSCLDDLPESMKLPFELLINIYEDLEQEMIKEGKLYCINYFKEEYKKFVRAYMIEARWLNENYKPTIEEYLHSSSISAGYSLVVTTSYIGIGDIATENIFKWATNEPKILKAASIISRLMDDIVSNEFEQKRKHVSSFLECYMNQYGESTVAAIRECQKKITNAWKDINEECLMPTNVPMPFLTRIFNLTCFMDVFYKDEDNFTHSRGTMKSSIKALLIDSMSI
ncbi:hypothetical protein Fmac_021369 [Flemingia macrophylla]|uniref:Uncharacterized protein n=1 Tax=Flemingia macrophylla TaxID=520843 RepID=A0ABD1LWN3_9FABA